MKIKNASLHRYSKTLLDQINWTINQGEHWALIGPAGSGKTSLLRALRTQAFISRGEINYPVLENMLPEYQKVNAFFTYKDLISIVGAKYEFRDLSSSSSNLYYQQRYNSLDSETVETVEAHIQKLRSVERPGYWTFDRVVSRFGLVHLKDKQLIMLSNGEAKRLLLASELVKNPVLLLMDNPLSGLDPETRNEMNKILSEIGDSGISIVMVTSSHEIPEMVTHVAQIKDYSVVTGSKEDMSSSISQVKYPSFDKKQIERLLIPVHSHYKIMVKMNNISVRYGERIILKNVDWEVKQKERWLLKGHNGAGKSTLLSLITGDNPQSYSNDIVLFDRKRGSGESIWDIKQKIGLVSAELYQYFPSTSTCLKVVESGFYDTMGLFRASDPEKAVKAKEWLEVLQVSEPPHTLFKNLSESTQRLVLLARALVKGPPLLILDEPCQGLDIDQQRFFKLLIETICEHSDITIIYVSHFQ
ncbi:MAG: ATP-binding cassette domain-containing protein, partial [Cyclobacteriaceae bacterium]|nr:ATP-binding cassette domain-containing protein [Cyclobacteriaceae bacterium SS2]